MGASRREVEALEEAAQEEQQGETSVVATLKVSLPGDAGSTTLVCPLRLWSLVPRPRSDPSSCSDR